jgi:hypothetical protein
MHLTYDATTDVAYLSFRATGPEDLIGPTLLLEHDLPVSDEEPDRAHPSVEVQREVARLLGTQAESGCTVALLR